MDCKKKNVLANTTRRLVFKVALTVSGMIGMCIQKVPRKTADWQGIRKAWVVGEKAQRPVGKESSESGASGPDSGQPLGKMSLKGQ